MAARSKYSMVKIMMHTISRFFDAVDSSTRFPLHMRTASPGTNAYSHRQFSSHDPMQKLRIEIMITAMTVNDTHFAASDELGSSSSLHMFCRSACTFLHLNVRGVTSPDFPGSFCILSPAVRCCRRVVSAALPAPPLSPPATPLSGLPREATFREGAQQHRDRPGGSWGGQFSTGFAICMFSFLGPGPVD